MIGKLHALVLGASTLGMLAASSAAMADHDHGRHRGWERGHHYGWRHERGWYPRHVVYYERPAYYYDPEPYYCPPPRPVYYGGGTGWFVGLNIGGVHVAAGSYRPYHRYYYRW